MTLIEQAKQNGFSVFSYAAQSERFFEQNLFYDRKTTFFYDLSVAEWFGLESVKDTYKCVMMSWLDNLEYITEFYVCLNHKIWEHYETYDELARLYDDLWHKCYDVIMKRYKYNDVALAYFYRMTD